MEKPQSHEIPSYLIIVFILLIVGIIVAGYAYYGNQKAHIKKEKQDELSAIVDLKAKQIHNWHKERLGDAEVIFKNPFIAKRIGQFIKNPNSPLLKQERLVWMESLKRQYTYRSVLLLDTKGKVLLIAGDKNVKVGSYAISLMNEALQKKSIANTDLHKGKTPNDIHIDLIVPIFSSKPTTIPLAILLLRIDSHWFLYPLIQSWSTPSRTAETLLIRREGNDVVYLNELRHRKDTALSFRLPISEKQLTTAMAVQGKEGIVEGVDYRGVPVLAAVKAIPDTPWFLVAKVDTEEVYAPITRITWVMFVITGMIILTAGAFLALLWSRQIGESYRKQYEAELERKTIAEQYGHLTRYANDIVMLLDQDLNIVNANEKATTTYGYKHDELLQMNAKDITPSGNWVSFENNIRHLDTKNGVVYEEINQRKNGRTFPVEISARTIEVGGKRLYQCIIRDITERKQAEETLRQSEQKYRNIFENSIEGIFQSTLEGQFISINSAMARIHGYESPEEMIMSITNIGKQLYVDPEERKRYKNLLEEHGIVENFESQFYRKDGTIMWISLTTRAVNDTSGKVLYYEGIVEDITSRKQAEEKLKQTAEKLRKTLAGTIQAMSLIVETRDPYTSGHQKRVSSLARVIAQEMGLSKDITENVRMAGIIHDIGKISVPAEILSKPTKLSNMEFGLIKFHPQSGYDILKDVELPYPIAKTVLQHHERLNGSGYPQGLKGENIILEARILAVADVVEAMASHRPYRPAKGVDVALEEIEKNKGILYDAEVVEVCAKLFREKGFKLEQIGVPN